MPLSTRIRIRVGKKINLVFFPTPPNHIQSLFSFVGTGKAQTKLKIIARSITAVVKANSKK